MFNESAGGSSSSRTSRRVPLGVFTSSDSRRPSTVPRTSIGPVPGSSENSNACSVKALSTCADVWSVAAVVAPSSDICSRPSSSSRNPSSFATVWLTVKPIFSPR